MGESGERRYIGVAGGIMKPVCNLGYRVNGVISDSIRDDLIIIEGVRGQAVSIQLLASV